MTKHQTDHYALPCGARVEYVEYGRRRSGACTGIIGFFWHPHVRLRTLARGEKASQGCDAVQCPRCRTKWEIMRDPTKAAA